MTPWSERIDVEIVVPVHDEQRVLQESIWHLHRYRSLHLPTLYDLAGASSSANANA